jgi:hypothetical protein
MKPIWVSEIRYVNTFLKRNAIAEAQIIHWFETLYHNSESCVLNNEHLSTRFKIERGGRQRVPLSPYLFVTSRLIYIQVNEWDVSLVLFFLLIEIIKIDSL